MTRTLPALALALTMPAVLSAQTIMDVNTLEEIEDVDVLTATGEDLGEVEAVLVNESGSPVAIVVEFGGFLGIGDSERVIPFDRVVWQDGNYVIDITEEDAELLPEWD